jgi:hypothetical protein
MQQTGFTKVTLRVEGEAWPWLLTRLARRRQIPMPVLFVEASTVPAVRQLMALAAMPLRSSVTLKYDAAGLHPAAFARKVYLFATTAKRDAAMACFKDSFEGEFSFEAYRIGSSGPDLTPHFLTMYFDIPEDVDGAIQKLMGHEHPVTKTYVREADAGAAAVDPALFAPDASFGSSSSGLLIS